MSGVTPTSDESALGRAQDVGAAIASVAKETGIAVFLAVWTVVWIALTYQTVQSEGLLDGGIVVAYTLLPVVGVVLWRLGERTAYTPPTVDELVGPDESTDDANRTANDEVVDRYTYGED